jgi:hypothetical protein
LPVGVRFTLIWLRLPVGVRFALIWLRLPVGGASGVGRIQDRR